MHLGRVICSTLVSCVFAFISSCLLLVSSSLKLKQCCSDLLFGILTHDFTVAIDLETGGQILIIELLAVYFVLLALVVYQFLQTHLQLLITQLLHLLNTLHIAYQGVPNWMPPSIFGNLPSRLHVQLDVLCRDYILHQVHTKLSLLKLVLGVLEVAVHAHFGSHLVAADEQLVEV